MAVDMLADHYTVSISQFNFNLPQYTCATDTTLKSVVHTLSTHQIGAIVIIDADHVVSGIFTERDFLTKVVGKKLNLEKEPVSDYMTRNPLYVKMTDSIWDIIRVMREGQFRHIAVLDNNRHLKRLVSIRDTLKFLYTYRYHLWDKDVVDAELGTPIYNFLDVEPPITCKDTATLEIVLDEMQSHHVGSVIVTDDQYRAKGIITERDFITKASQSILALPDLSVADYMTPNPLTLTINHTVEDAYHMMETHHIRHLIIRNQSNIPTNMISIKELHRFFSQIPLAT